MSNSHSKMTVQMYTKHCSKFSFAVQQSIMVVVTKAFVLCWNFVGTTPLLWWEASTLERTLSLFLFLLLYSVVTIASIRFLFFRLAIVSLAFVPFSDTYLFPVSLFILFTYNSSSSFSFSLSPFCHLFRLQWKAAWNFMLPFQRPFHNSTNFLFVTLSLVSKHCHIALSILSICLRRILSISFSFSACRLIFSAWISYTHAHAFTQPLSLSHTLSRMHRNSPSRSLQRVHTRVKTHPHSHAHVFSSISTTVAMIATECTIPEAEDSSSPSSSVCVPLLP